MGLRFLGGLRFRGLRFLVGVRFRGLRFLVGVRFFKGVFVFESLRSSFSRHPVVYNHELHITMLATHPGKNDYTKENLFE